MNSGGGVLGSRDCALRSGAGILSSGGATELSSAFGH